MLSEASSATMSPVKKVQGLKCAREALKLKRVLEALKHAVSSSTKVKSSLQFSTSKRELNAL